MQYLASSVAATVKGVEKCGTAVMEIDFDVAIAPGFNAVLESGTSSQVSIKSSGSVSPIVLSAFF